MDSVPSAARAHADCKLPANQGKVALGHVQSQSPGYRPDIDGLRAVAVVAVVLFHVGAPFAMGGYIGVDVFFVISGFLITGIIARELSLDCFSLLEFYRRRARRIFPALAVVALATLAVGYALLTPKEYVELGESTASIAAFSSNFYFWSSVSYWAPGIQPLLHTWSLAVEEQFYLIFPLFLMLTHGRRRVMIFGLWTVFSASFILSVIMVAWKPQMAFYLLPSRAWELMLGGLLALGVFGRGSSGTRGKIASIAGLALILGPVLFYAPSTPFPGIMAVPPVLGAALLIWGRGWGLSARPLVAIGAISYSFYLWHLPVIDYAKYLVDRPLSTGEGLLAATVSLAMAGLSYRYVETPFRQGSRRAEKTVFAAIAMPAMAVAALAIVHLDGIPLRVSPIQAQQLAVLGDEARHPSRCMSIGDRWIDPAKPCRFGASPHVLLWGDSHSMVTASSLEAAGASFLFAADADCPIGKGLSISPFFERVLVSQGHYRHCGDYNKRMLERALRPDIHTVILSSRWTNWRIGEPANPAETSVDIRLVDEHGVSRGPADNRSMFERAFSALVLELTRAGKRVIIVGPVPEPTFNVPHRLYVSGFGFAPSNALAAEYQTRHKVILEFFARFKDTRGVSFIWPAAKLCTVACPVARDGVPIYFDHNHLTVAEARRLAPLYRDLAS